MWVLCNDELHIELVEQEAISISVIESDVCSINLEVNEVNFVADAVFEQRLSDLENNKYVDTININW